MFYVPVLQRSAVPGFTNSPEKGIWVRKNVPAGNQSETRFQQKYGIKEDMNLLLNLFGCVLLDVLLQFQYASQTAAGLPSI